VAAPSGMLERMISVVVILSLLTLFVGFDGSDLA
jgi:hypothetical protein